MSRKDIDLHMKYRKDILRFANSILHDPYLAEDVVQEVFLRLHEYVDNIGDIESVQAKNYVMTITKNVALNMIRKVHKEVPLSSINEVSVQENQDKLLVLKEVLKSLPLEQRNTLHLNLMGYSIQEIAKILNENPGTIQRRLYRTKQYLQAELGEIDE